MQLARLSGVIVEALGAGWVAFSPSSGETALLNNECAAILEVLEGGPADVLTICQALAADCGLPVDELLSIVDSHQQVLIQAGLVQLLAHPASRAA